MRGAEPLFTKLNAPTLLSVPLLHRPLSWGDDENQTSNSAQDFLNPAFDGLRGQVGDTVYREFIPSGDQTSLRASSRSMNASWRAVRGRSYTVQQAVGLYAASGTSDDYAFSRHRVNPALNKVRGFTIEFGWEFVPPTPRCRRSWPTWRPRSPGYASASRGCERAPNCPQLRGGFSWIGHFGCVAKKSEWQV
jgi:murein tripeptide amidase MpaA